MSHPPTQMAKDIGRALSEDIREAAARKIKLAIDAGLCRHDMGTICRVPTMAGFGSTTGSLTAFSGEPWSVHGHYELIDMMNESGRRVHGFTIPDRTELAGVLLAVGLLLQEPVDEANRKHFSKRLIDMANQLVPDIHKAPDDA